MGRLRQQFAALEEGNTFVFPPPAIRDRAKLRGERAAPAVRVVGVPVAYVWVAAVISAPR